MLLKWELAFKNREIVIFKKTAAIHLATLPWDALECRDVS